MFITPNKSGISAHPCVSLYLYSLHVNVCEMTSLDGCLTTIYVFDIIPIGNISPKNQLAFQGTRWKLWFCIKTMKNAAENRRTSKTCFGDFLKMVQISNSYHFWPRLVKSNIDHREDSSTGIKTMQENDDDMV